MSWTSTTIVLFVFVIIVLGAAGLTAITQYMTRIQHALEHLDRIGRQIREWKDRHFVRHVDRLPLSADTMTLGRLIAIIVSLSANQHQHRLAATLWFGLAWLLDLFDGLKAQAEQQRRGRPTPWGKYLDPVVDVLCFLLMTVTLRRHFPVALAYLFGGLILLRVTLFLGSVVARLSRQWRERISSTILPESIAGRFKTVFVALAFGLVIAAPQATVVQILASVLLTFACVLEAISLAQQIWRVLRQFTAHHA